MELFSFAVWMHKYQINKVVTLIIKTSYILQEYCTGTLPKKKNLETLI
jgi:hypothetical protein